LVGDSNEAFVTLIAKVDRITVRLRIREHHDYRWAFLHFDQGSKRQKRLMIEISLSGKMRL